MQDNRIHLLLYFFDGKYANANDLTNISKLQKYVNVLPVIGKADGYSK